MTIPPIRTALASFGMSGVIFHAPLLMANKGFQLATVLERTKNIAQRLYPEITIIRSFKELCQDDKIELVVVNTPDHTHLALTKMALEHGKHVVVEKPFTLRYEDAITLIEIAKKNGVVLGVFQNRRWDGDFLTVQKIVKEQLLGRLVSYEAHYDRYRNFIQTNTWKEDPTSGTGTLYNLGSHLIDQALLLLGKPVSVFADIRTLRAGGGVDDSFDVWLEYPDLKAKVCGSYLVREPGPRYALHGTEGSFLKWGIDPQEEDLKAGKQPGGASWGVEPEEQWGLLHTNIEGKTFRGKYPGVPGNYMLFYDGIYNAIRNQKPLPVTAEEGAMVVKVIEACLESARTRCAVSIL